MAKQVKGVKKLPVPVAMEVSPEEEQQLQQLRELKEKKLLCAKEIDAVLVKHQAKLSIDPNSAFGSPAIVVTI